MYIIKYLIDPKVQNMLNSINTNNINHEQYCQLYYEIIRKNSDRWFFNENDELHRHDGPALDFSKIRLVQKWFYNGKEIPCSNQQEFEKMIKLLAFL